MMPSDTLEGLFVTTLLGHGVVRIWGPGLPARTGSAGPWAPVPRGRRTAPGSTAGTAELGPSRGAARGAAEPAGWAVSPVLPGPRAEGAAGAAEPPREKAGTADAPHVYPRLRGRPGTGVTCGCGTVLTGSSIVGTSFDPNELLGEKGPVRGGCVACDSMGDSGILTAVKELCIYTCVF